MIRTIKKEAAKSSKLTRRSHFYQSISRRLIKNFLSLPSQYKYNLTISHDKRVVWYRVAKVGTRTIFELFRKGDVNLDAEHPMFCHYPPALYNDYFKFAFVRNPWDRVVSCWKNKVLDYNYLDLSSEQLHELKDFSHFIEYISLMNMEECDHHLRLQSKLIDLNNIDYVGRFENFESDLRVITERLNLQHLSIPHKNATHKNESYQTFYTNETRQKVYELYEKDIKIFGYKFE